jgi:hypothetical protein
VAKARPVNSKNNDKALMGKVLCCSTTGKDTQLLWHSPAGERMAYACVRKFMYKPLQANNRAKFMHPKLSDGA